MYMQWFRYSSHSILGGNLGHIGRYTSHSYPTFGYLYSPAPHPKQYSTPRGGPYIRSLYMPMGLAHPRELPFRLTYYIHIRHYLSL